MRGKYSTLCILRPIHLQNFIQAAGQLKVNLPSGVPVLAALDVPESAAGTAGQL